MAEKSSLKWWVLTTVIVGTFLGRLDQSIVNLALPKIIDSFAITISSAGWIATAYIIANAIFVPIWGKLGDTIGRKKVYITGFVIFIIGSILAGLSWNLSSMLVFRVIQAVASSADYPTAMAIIAVTFTDAKERAQALGIWSATFAVGGIFGPLIGGPLIDTFGWRSVFFINVPVGLVGLTMALTYIKESVVASGKRAFDWWGASALGVSLSALVLVLDQGLAWGWTSLDSILCYIAVVVFMAIFIYIEQHHPEPVMDLKFFKNALFVNTVFNNFIVFMAMMGSIFLIPIFAQTFMGLTATQAGYLFLPLAFAFMISAPIGGKLIGKVKPGYVIAGSTFIAAIGLYCFVWIDPRSTPFDIIWPLFIMAFGMGFGMAQRTNLIAVAVPTNEIGVASSILALARNIAGAFGIAIFATILNKATTNNVFNIMQNSVFHFTNAAQMQTAIGLINLKAQVSSYGTVFVVASLVMLVGAVTALWIKVDKNKLEHVGTVHLES
jgi:DHA2 family multidrug resistance protein